jgi:hypothetical protein
MFKAVPQITGQGDRNASRNRLLFKLNDIRNRIAIVIDAGSIRPTVAVRHASVVHHPHVIPPGNKITSEIKNQD